MFFLCSDCSRESIGLRATVAAMVKSLKRIREVQQGDIPRQEGGKLFRECAEDG